MRPTFWDLYKLYFCCVPDTNNSIGHQQQIDNCIYCAEFYCLLHNNSIILFHRTLREVTEFTDLFTIPHQRINIKMPSADVVASEWIVWHLSVFVYAPNISVLYSLSRKYTVLWKHWHQYCQLQQKTFKEEGKFSFLSLS